MSDSYKHSYIVGENLLNSLSVYNVGYQKCDRSISGDRE